MGGGIFQLKWGYISTKISKINPVTENMTCEIVKVVTPLKCRIRNFKHWNESEPTTFLLEGGNTRNLTGDQTLIDVNIGR